LGDGNFHKTSQKIPDTGQGRKAISASSKGSLEVILPQPVGLMIYFPSNWGEIQQVNFSHFPIFPSLRR
jgi:hypothetical protein